MPDAEQAKTNGCPQEFFLTPLREHLQPPTPFGYKRLRMAWGDGLGHTMPALFLKPPRIEQGAGSGTHQKYDVFFIGSLTRLPLSQRLLYFEIVSAVQMLLQYEFNVNFSNAPLHTDSTLAAIPIAKTRNSLCYILDTESVKRAHFIIAELTYASHGTGMELECANANRIPVLALTRRHSKGASWLGKISTAINKFAKFEFYLSDQNEPLAKKTLMSGGNEVSPMALGTPAILKAIYYDAPNVLYQFVELAALLLARSKLTSFIGRKMLMSIHGGEGWLSKALSMHRRFENKAKPTSPCDDPVSLLLRKLHNSIRKYVRLQPNSHALGARLERLQKSLERNSKTPEEREQIALEVAQLERKISLLGELRKFNPSERMRTLVRLKEAFPENADNHSLVDSSISFDEVILFRHRRTYDTAKAETAAAQLTPPRALRNNASTARLPQTTAVPAPTSPLVASSSPSMPKP